MPPAGIPSGDSGNIQVLLQVFCTEEADINCERQRTVLDEFSWLPVGIIPVETGAKHRL